MSCECRVPRQGVWVTLWFPRVTCPKINEDGSVQFSMTKMQLYAMQAEIAAAIADVEKYAETEAS